MKKRLRKKKCIGEFAEMGFELKATYPEMNDEQLDAFMAKVMGKVGEFGMYCGGGFFIDGLDLFVCTGKVNTDEAARKEQFVEWFKGALDGIEVTAGDLVDANYEL
jgi:uncharacterized protein YggL (DUF469 family)